MKSIGEIESAVCEGMNQFQQQYMGRGPKDIRAYLMEDILLVRLIGVLTTAERFLVKTHPPAKGRDLLKEVRTCLVETARAEMQALISSITGVNVISMHHDISTVTGEEIVVFTLSEAPSFRITNKKQ